MQKHNYYLIVKSVIPQSFSFQLGSILMRVIRTLSETGSVEDREDEKKKLEQKFRESDTKVDQVCSDVRLQCLTIYLL